MGKNPLADAGEVGSVPESGRFPGEGNGNPLQYSCLANPRDREASELQLYARTKLNFKNIMLARKSINVSII